MRLENISHPNLDVLPQSCSDKFYFPKHLSFGHSTCCFWLSNDSPKCGPPSPMGLFFIAFPSIELSSDIQFRSRVPLSVFRSPPPYFPTGKLTNRAFLVLNVGRLSLGFDRGFTLIHSRDCCLLLRVGSRYYLLLLSPVFLSITK